MSTGDCSLGFNSIFWMVNSELTDLFFYLFFSERYCNDHQSTNYQEIGIPTFYQNQM